MQRIGQIAVLDPQFEGGGKGLAEDGIVFDVGRVDEREVVGRDGHRELGDGVRELLPLLVGQGDAQQAFKGIEVADGVAHLPVPVAPVGHGGGFVEAAGDLLLSGAPGHEGDP